MHGRLLVRASGVQKEAGRRPPWTRRCGVRTILAAVASRHQLDGGDRPTPIWILDFSPSVQPGSKARAYSRSSSSKPASDQIGCPGVNRESSVRGPRSTNRSAAAYVPARCSSHASACRGRTAARAEPAGQGRAVPPALARRGRPSDAPGLDLTRPQVTATRPGALRASAPRDPGRRSTVRGHRPREPARRRLRAALAPPPAAVPARARRFPSGVAQAAGR